MIHRDDQPEPRLPGYELIEKIGSGGYGEVWSAIAPGGLRKAIKFVFGDQFDRRAAKEMHSLEKVKAARHPFLLSLERIEVVDNRLVVVSELADSSLRDRFAECVEGGLPGIPREELLGYLADTADALDYIGREHDLAHLDIKPENLLLVAGHVKVADFGLVKSIGGRATQASLVGGMTPAYAAPELFRGAPCRHSDQYSLAILYTELLTGLTPFPGSTAAELTLQHMNDSPDLSRLNEADRFPVSRALSKAPEHRYPASGDFVAAIRSASQAGGAMHFGPAESAESGARHSDAKRQPALLNRATEVFDQANAASGGDSLLIEPPALTEPTPRELPAQPEALESAPEWEATPALFVGVGGVGGEVLGGLRRVMDDRLEQGGRTPAAAMLLLDTDPQALAAATLSVTGSSALDADETVSLPLRRPQAYRAKSEELLRWLGRRWLYNVPRSLRTEGLRPLGRLALVDHARQVVQRLRGAILTATGEETLEASESATGVCLRRNALRVYVVASPSGGTASGLSIDVAYAIRSVLQREGIADAWLIGVAPHRCSRDARAAELARVNSYAWLGEFEQLRTSPAGYPGDAGAGLPAHEPGVAAFDHTYYLPLEDGVDLNAGGFGAEGLVEYLYADAFTPAQRELDRFRAETAGGESVLRSFAVSASDDGEGADTEPPIGDCGGVYRQLNGVAPDGAASGIAITEMAQLSLPHVACGLTSGRRDYAAFAERVRTRRDQPWIDPVSSEQGQVAPTTSASPVA